MEQLKTDNETLIEVKNLVKYYPVYGGVFKRVVAQVKAVDDVSFAIKKGETLGLVGESGCGKSTVGHTMLGLLPHTSGSVLYKGENLFDLKAKKKKKCAIIYKLSSRILTHLLTRVYPLVIQLVKALIFIILATIKSDLIWSWKR